MRPSLIAREKRHILKEKEPTLGSRGSQNSLSRRSRSVTEGSFVDDIVDEYDGNYDTRCSADSNVNESSSADSPQHVELKPVHTDTQSVHRTDDRVLPSAGGHQVPSVVNPDNPRATSVASERSTKSASSVVSDKSSQRNTSGSDSVLMQSMNKLIKAQSDMLTVQTQAVAIQGLPSLKKRRCYRLRGG